MTAREDCAEIRNALTSAVMNIEWLATKAASVDLPEADTVTKAIDASFVRITSALDRIDGGATATIDRVTLSYDELAAIVYAAAVEETHGEGSSAVAAFATKEGVSRVLWTSIAKRLLGELAECARDERQAKGETCPVTERSAT